MITLRPYQEKIIAETRELLKANRSVLICAPCGSGKGSLISYMVHGAVTRGKRVIFAVHGRALVADMSERVSRLGIEHGVLMSGTKRERWHPVQVASIDTLHRMTHRPKADLLILDEARTFISNTGRMVLDDYPPTTKIIGADATPERLDGKGLGVQSGGIFEAMVMGPSEQELIDNKFLLPCVVFGTPNPPDVDGVKKSGGDFNQKDLAAICDRVKLVGDIVEHWLREASDRKTVAFGVDQAHARHITEQFRAANVEWEYVDASTPDGSLHQIGSRINIWHRLDHPVGESENCAVCRANGQTKPLMGFSNVMIAGVGWDHPIVSCIIAARPTASLSLWRQMLSRPDRPYPGQTDYLLLDHAGNVVRHWPYGFLETPPAWNLEGKKGRKSSSEESVISVATCKVPIPVPESGPLRSFRGPLSPDGKYMLPSYHTFRSGPTECPYCGIPLSIGDGRKVEVEAGRLVDLSDLREKAKAEVKKSAAQLAHEARMKLRYLELVKQGQRGGKSGPYRPGWALLAFRSEFNRYPNKAWKDEVLEMLPE